MKRSPALEPFSRDHNVGLALARSLQRGDPGAPERFQNVWNNELEDHFQEEERLLDPFCDEKQTQKLRDDHDNIAQLSKKLPVSAEQLGQALEAHIRWEERVLFPSIEAKMSPQDADALRLEANEMEVRRWEQDTHREKLVRRRWAENPSLTASSRDD